MFLRHLDFCVCVKSTDFKIYDIIIGIATQWKLHLSLFLLNTSIIKMKFGQISVCCMTNFSNMYLALCWRLETSFRPFYDFIKMIMYQDLAVFNSWHFKFLIVLYSPFQKKMEHWNLAMFGYWVIGAGCQIEKDLELSCSPQNCSKDFWKLLPLFISIDLPSMVT